MFDPNGDVLVQFRLSVGFVFPPFVRNLGDEGDELRANRMDRNSEKGRMQPLLMRTGASLAIIRYRLADVGLKLADVYAQQRSAPVTLHRDHEKPYKLLTFVFRADAEERGQKNRQFFDDMAKTRWDSITVNAGRGRDNRPLFCVMAKSQAPAAVMLKELDDPEATIFGVIVSRSVPKRDRPAE